MTSNDSGLRPLPARTQHAHKGTAGTLLVMGGSCAADVRMAGAPALAACGGLRAGAGLVRLLVPEPIALTTLALAPSATAVSLAVNQSGVVHASAAAETLDRQLINASALVIGPGMGEDPSTLALALRAVQQEQAPVVVDAGAITSLSHVPSLSKDFRARAVLTPHPGEFRRLAEPLRIGADPVDPASRSRACEEMAQRLGCIVVLKGHGTVVSNGLETWTCRRGHPCMATGGTGDVLAGVIGGLLAQHAPEPVNPLLEAARAKAGVKTPPPLSIFDLACIGVDLHAAAGEAWSQRHATDRGMMAMELADLIPDVMGRYVG
jgi:NAD(P)H-hydrate epimerase